MFHPLFDAKSHFNIANIFTLVNITMGVLSIYLVAHHHFFEAIIAIWIGGVCDILDGKLARKYKLSSEFGVQIDSFADFISFVIVPSFLVFEAIFSKQTTLILALAGIVLIYYVISGLRRLIVFNLTTHSGEVSKYFTGIPTPLGAILLWLLYLSFAYDLITNSFLLLALIVLVAYLLNSRVKIPHP